MNDQIQSKKGKRVGVLIIICGLAVLAALVVQWRSGSELRRENLALRSTALVTEDVQHSETVSQEQWPEPTASAQEAHGSVQKEKSELLRLRNEVRQLRERVAETNVSRDAKEAQPVETSEHNQPVQWNPNPIVRTDLTSEWRGMEQFATNKYAQAIERLANATNHVARFHALGDVAKMNFAFGRAEDAQADATELLALAERYKAEPWSHGCGQAVHDGNIVLGRLALEQGAIDDAKRYLLEAGTSSGSPVLGSFGPNMSLARDLLERGERETVVQYFERCGQFWKPEALQQWSEEVNAGRIPNFGANLIY